MRLLFRPFNNIKSINKATTKFSFLFPKTTTTTTTSSSSCSFSYSWLKMASFSTLIENNINIKSMMMKKKNNKYDEKVVVIMGSTGSGKSRLSIDIAKHIPSEIINSDKIQLYKGLDVTTNKIPFHQRLNIPHHLLAEVDSSFHGEVSPTQYRYKAISVISSIHSRNKLPLLVGGSNSYIYALLADDYSPYSDIFSGPGRFDPICNSLRYKCCFLWMDMSEEVLGEYLDKRVDEMIESGMVEELSDFYESGMVDEIEPNTAIRKSIGVPEFDRYFREGGGGSGRDSVRRDAYEEAVRSVKDNTWQLAKNQLGKIQRLRNGGWDIHRLDGTDAFKAVLQESTSWSDIWKQQVVEPSMKIVKNFLQE